MEIIKTRVAVLVANAFGEPFDDIRQQTFARNWGRLRDHGVDVFLLSGNQCNQFQLLENRFNEFVRHSKFRWFQRLCNRVFRTRRISKTTGSFRDNEIVVEVPDQLKYLLHKFVVALGMIEEYDYVLKSTLSSVIHIPIFLEFIESIPLDRPVIAGHITRMKNFDLFSGSNMILNQYAIRELVKNSKKLDITSLDDVAISKFAHQRFEKKALKSLNIETVESAKRLNQREISQITHFRCRSNQKPRQDIDIILEVLDIIG